MSGIPDSCIHSYLEWERDGDEWDHACDIFPETDGLRRVLADDPGRFLGGKRPYRAAVRSAVEKLIDVADLLYRDGHMGESAEMCELLWAACGGREERFNDLFCDYWDSNAQCWNL